MKRLYLWLRALYRHHVVWVVDRPYGRELCSLCEGSGFIDLPTGTPIQSFRDVGANTVECTNCHTRGFVIVPL